MTFAEWMLSGKPPRWTGFLWGLVLWGLVGALVFAWPKLPWWFERTLMVWAAVGLYTAIAQALRRAEERAQRRTDAYVGACDAVKAIATKLQSSTLENITYRWRGDRV